MLTASDFKWNLEQSEVTKVFPREDLGQPWTLDLDTLSGD